AIKIVDDRNLFSSRRRHTRSKRDWSSDVCSSDLPKMLPHIPHMRVFIAEDLGCHMDDVNVKATTTEKLGFTGRGEGIACEAVAQIGRASCRERKASWSQASLL